MSEKESKTFKRYTITSALPYANGPVHIGHLAGVYVPADIYARYLRLRYGAEKVLFIGGSDEHGVPITIKAKNEGITPQQVVDKYHNIIKDSFEEFGISFDVYSRTSLPVHHETAAEIFKTLYDKGEFIEKVTEQYYDEEAKQFLADRYITGTCPKCSYDKAYGDQCESCGSTLNATDLINPRSSLSGNIPILKETKHWFLPLDKYEPWLKEWILLGHKDDWKVNVYGQCKSWIDGGLQPRAVTRDLDWGIKVPLPDADKKVLYVWFDAPIGYISATKVWAKEKNKDWEIWWKNKESKLVHFIGKDNIVFHCIIFPSILKAEGSFILPENVPANEFLNLEGDKISTSRNWAVWLHEYLKDFPNKQDVLRYVLTANAPETKDNDFTWKDFQTRNNSELVAIFGNFINRTLVLTNNYFKGIVPEISKETELDQEIRNRIFSIKGLIEEKLENYKFRDALKDLIQLARYGNEYLAQTEPWKLIKTDEERVKTILNIALQISAGLAILSEPFLPFTSKKLKKLLNIENLTWNDLTPLNQLKAGHQINQPELLFEKIEDEAIEKQIQKLADTKKSNELVTSEVKPAKEFIEYADFEKMDIRVGTIIEAEKVVKTKKLMKLLIDTGIDKRTVVSGIAEYYEPKDVIGKQVSILVNLAPKELKGITSNGMILMAEDKDGKLVFTVPADKTTNGSIVK